jgi:hypothetical protein
MMMMIIINIIIIRDKRMILVMTTVTAQCIELSNDGTHNSLYYVCSTGLRADSTRLEAMAGYPYSLYTPSIVDNAVLHNARISESLSPLYL